ncbi:LON peptidase substrate-binding domain-containing protein [Nocardioides panacisoli]|uniref:LON peptidase substrate-binding domain-containing protein n=1 Tax=Nocardioides panacisoli TaxID=627624 RepID=UPI001C6382C5|nr:LON peptidase substrate-binding domain-containing protein [Nocardioides panacisoli]QYJ04756.1 LON peptidase substrate-binding domain-containing protein [Nocardioides panacisoli]
MATTLPMFPLSTVLFPGASVPLRIFEDRYTALVRELLDVADPADRVFGSVAIREGYEVGDHGAQSLFRLGVRLQLTQHEAHEDGTFDIVAVVRDRIRLNRLTPTDTYPVGEVEDVPETGAPVDDEVAIVARGMFTAYRHQVGQFATDPHPGTLPRDPGYLSWALAAAVPLPMPERQALLENDDATDRLTRLTTLLRSELRALNVIPSLPATDVARNRFSPN